MDDGTVEMVQMDGHFCHGDYNHPYCPSIQRYANDKTRSECENQTKARDEFILNWMMKHNATGFKYTVITDCCHPEYSSYSLDQAFENVKPLLDLVDGLDELDGTIESIDFEKVMFVAIIEGHTKKQTGPLQPVFPMDLEDKEPTIASDKMLLTSDYYHYLKNNFDFVITKVEWMMCYKKSPHLNQVFGQLITKRQQAGMSSSISSFYKSIVNLACGFFGLNPRKKPKSTVRVAYRQPKNFCPSKDKVAFLGNYQNQDLFLVKTTFPTSPNSCTKTPLIHFISVIEYGKLRLNFAIQVLKQFTRPHSCKLLYSNIDNMIIACSEKTIEECLANNSEQGVAKFNNVWKTVFGQGPGMLKEEWFVDSSDDWKFVSPYKMYYVVKSNNKDICHYKMNFVQLELGHDMFDVALNVLKNQSITVQIKQRVNKLANTSTQIKNVTLNN